jgi:hypothetical protein
MPYEISFRKKIEPRDGDLYINDCCIGGDIVSACLLPTVREQYEAVLSEQEDWGWFIWFRRGPIRLAIDIFCDDPESGLFRIHLTSRRRMLLFFDRVVDAAEIETVKDLVVYALSGWGVAGLQVTRLGVNLLPLG